MATQNNIKIGIDISDNGTGAKQIKTAKEIKGAYESAAASAAKLGGTAGSKKAASAAFTASTGAQMSEQTYSNLRGNAGATGASARDFANQSQGLGGLVRLYATYAANVFAVGAAFRALSAAMDTSNMVRGLDQLGAASGTALGSLSKRLVTATDGAISLREAMEATAKASSSGMSSDNILRMATAAKKASQALGVDMADAVSRMTRGITKMEPELLDELGIFVRVDDVVNEYARSVGRAASSLTDFERRQAYANAVIGQAEKKFGEIKLDSNPYNKLLASMKDLSQAGLELINKVLTPLVDALAASPTTLAVAMAGIGAVLVKQALPAIGQMRAGLAASAVDAAEVAKRFRESFNDEFQTKLEQRFRIPNLKADIAKTEAELKQLQSRIKPVKYLDTDENGLLIKSTAELNKKLLHKQNIVETGMLASRKASEAELSQRKAEIAAIEKAILLDKQRRELTKAFDASVMSVSDMPGRTDPETIAILRAEKLQQRADKTMAVSNAAQNAQIMGIRGSWELLNQEITDKGIKGITKYTTLAQGGLAAVGSRVMGLISSFGYLGTIVGLVAGAFAAVDAYFSKNKEQVAAFDKAIERSDASLKNLSNTLEYISKRPVLEQLNPASMQARANAVKEVTASLDEQVTTLMAVDAAADKWDKFIDGWKTLWGGDVLSKFSDSAGKTIDGMLKKLGNSSEAEKFKQVLSDALEIRPENLNLNTIEAAIEKLGKNAPNALKNLTKEFDNISTAMQVTAAKGTEMEAAFAKSAEMRKTMADKLKPSDDMTKYGQALIDQFKAVSLALDDPKQKLNAIRSLAKSMQELPGTTISEALGLRALARDAEEAQAAQLKLAEISAKIAETQEKKSALGSAVTSAGLKELIALNNELRDLQAQREVLIKVKTELSGKIEAGSQLIEQAQLKVFETGAAKISSVLSAEWAKAGAAIGSAYATILSGTETGIKMRAESEKRVISAQISAIEEQRKNTLAVQALKLQLKRNEIEEKRKRIPEYDSTAEDKALAYEERALQAAQSGNVKGLYKKLADEMKQGETSMTGLNTGALDFAQSMEASAAQVAALRAQIAAIDIKAGDDRVKLDYENRRKALEEQLKGLAASKDSLGVYKEAVSASNMQYLLDTQALDTKTLQTQQAVERLAVEVEIARLERIRNANPGVKDEITKLELRKKQMTALQDAALITQKQSQAVQREKAQYEGIIENIELEDKLNTNRLARKEQELKLETDRIALLKETGALLDSAAIKATGSLEAKKAELDYEKQLAEAKKTRDLATAKLNSDRKIISLSVAGEVPDATQAQALADIDAKLQQVNNTYQTLEGSILRAKDAQLQGLSAITAYKLEQQALSESVDKLKSLDLVFEGLGSSLEGFGSKLAAVVTTFAEGEATTRKYATAVAEAQSEYDKFDNRDDGPDKVAAYKKLTDAQSAQAKAEQDANLKTLNSTKKLFKEKTAAYKVLDAVEKASHIMKVGRWIKEQAVHLASILVPAAAAPAAAAIEVSTNAATAAANTAVSTPAMIMKVGSQLGMFAFPVIAAILAMAGSSGGGKSSPAITAEMRQETQGTAMGYNAAGEKVQVREGVFGDTDAKSEAIAKSLEIIRDNSVDGLDYNNKMLKALIGIRDEISVSAKSLYRISGLSSGSMFGNQNVSVSTSGISGFFGSSTTKEIIDSGVQLQGTFYELANATSGVVRAFEVTQRTKKKSGFLGIGGGTSVSFDTSFLDLDASSLRAFTNIFQYGQDLLYSAAEFAGISEEAVTSELKNLKVDEMISLRGLTGEEFEKELSSVFGAILSDASSAIFSAFEVFQQFGEDMLQTTIRVIDTNAKVKQVLQNQLLPDFEAILATTGTQVQVVAQKAVIGLNDSIMNVYNSLAKSFPDGQVIYEYGGGEGGPSYSSNTVTNLVKQNAKYGWSPLGYGEDLREYGKAVIKAEELFGIDDLGKLSQEQLTQLREAGGNFTKVITDTIYQTVTSYNPSDLKVSSIAITENLVKLADGIDNFLDITNSYNSAFLSESERLVPVQAAVTKEMARLGLAGVDTRDEFNDVVRSLDLTTTAGQETYIALMKVSEGFAKVYTAPTALQAAETRLQKVYENRKKELEDLISTWKSVSESLVKFKADLLKGSESPLTPQQKFALAQAEYEKTIATLSSSTASEDEKAKAAQEFSGVAQTLLSTGKTIYASSGAYQDLYNRVLDDTDMAAKLAETNAAKFTSDLSALNAIAEQMQLSVTYEEKSSNMLEAMYSLFKEKFGAANAQANVDAVISGSQDKQINDLYIKAGGTGADAEGLAFWKQYYKDVGDFAVVTKAFNDVADQWIEQNAATETNSRRIVESAYERLLGRTGDAEGIDFWVNALKAPGGLHLNDFEEEFLKAAKGAEIKIPGMATGGYATSWTVVGEEGPELVNFTNNPGRVYSNENSFDLLNPRSNTNDAVVQELQKLRKTVEHLQAQQAQQTNAIINSNYDANLKAADKVGASVSDAAKQKEWDAKNGIKLK